MSEPNLTERETSIIRLRDDEGLSWSKIGERLGTTRGSVNSSYRAAKIKLDRTANPEKYPSKPRGQSNLSEFKRPELRAASSAATDPIMTIKRAAREAGLPKSIIDGLLKRMNTDHGPANDAIREMKKAEVVKIIDGKVLQLLGYIDDYAMGAATLNQLCVATGILVDKSLLLQGEPTAILRFQDIRKLEELGTLFQAEMERRGKLIDVTPEPSGGP